MKAYPTLYRGIQMRSRLEARWACYFDLRGDSEWNYESVDLDGWIPDFELKIAKATRHTLVEVKPIREIETFALGRDGAKVARAIMSDPHYIINNYNGILLLGMDPDYSWFFGPRKNGMAIWERLPKHPLPMRRLWHEAGNATQWKAPR